MSTVFGIDADMFMDILADSGMDAAKMLIPLFVIFLASAMVMRRVRAVRVKDSIAGVAVGSLCGLVPQCGVPVGFAELYARAEIGLGLLIAVFLASSDEALVIAAAKYEFAFVAKLAVIKVLCGFAVGAVILAVCGRGSGGGGLLPLKDDCALGTGPECPCVAEHDHHHDTFGSLVLGSVREALMTAVYIFISAVVLNMIVEGVGEEAIADFASGRSLWAQPLFTVPIGFIPTCASSVFVTEAYMSGTVSFGALVAGLCANTGYGILVLFRALPLRRSLAVAALLLVLSAAVGTALTAASVFGGAAPFSAWLAAW